MSANQNAIDALNLNSLRQAGFVSEADYFAWRIDRLREDVEFYKVREELWRREAQRQTTTVLDLCAPVYRPERSMPEPTRETDHFEQVAAYGESDVRTPA